MIPVLRQFLHRQLLLNQGKFQLKRIIKGPGK